MALIFIPNLTAPSFSPVDGVPARSPQECSSCAPTPQFRGRQTAEQRPEPGARSSPPELRTELRTELLTTAPAWETGTGRGTGGMGVPTGKIDGRKLVLLVQSLTINPIDVVVPMHKIQWGQKWKTVIGLHEQDFSWKKKYFKAVRYIGHNYLDGYYIYIFQSGEASQWRVCYQRGLPRLVFLHIELKFLTLRISAKPEMIWVIFFMLNC